MTSFYGGGGGSSILDNLPSSTQVEIVQTLSGNIIVSKTEPVGQQQGDMWFVVEEFEN